MKIGDWRRLTSYWDRHPPACELIEALAGWTAPAPAREPTEAELRQLADLAAGGA